MPEPVIIKVGADLGELTAKLESIQSQLDELKGTARQPGEELKKSFTGATGAMNEVKMSAKQLDAEIRAVTESMKKTNDPKAIAALKEYRQELIQEEQQLGKTTQKFESMRGKIMAIKNELFKLRAEGKQGTQRFQELTVELARLGNMKDDINELGKALSSDTRHIDGMIQGVQGLVGAFSIFQGVQMLVGSENKEFQQAMMKMMATMQILNGVQQVANILQKESALMQTLAALGIRKKTVATVENTTATIANNAAMEGTESAIGGVENATTGMTGAMGASAASVMAVAAALAAAVLAVGYFTNSERVAAEVSEDFTMAIEGTNSALNKHIEGLNSVKNDIDSYIKKLKDTGKTEGQLIREKILDGQAEVDAIIANYKEKQAWAKKEIQSVIAEHKAKKDKGLITYSDKLINTVNHLNGLYKSWGNTITILEQKKKDITDQTLSEIEAAEKYAQSIKGSTEKQIKYATAIEKTSLIIPQIISSTIDYETEARKLDQSLINNWITFEDYTKILRSLNAELGIMGKIDLSGFMKDWEDQFTKQDTFFQSFVQEGDTWNRERTKQVIDGTMSMYNQLNDILLKNEAQKNDQLIKGIDDRYSKEKKKLDEDLKNKKLSQEQYDKEAVKLEEQKDRQIAKIKREQWKKEQKAAIAKATINTLVGMTQALAEGGIAGIITGALVLAAGIAEVASISSQKNPYRKGTAQILNGNSHEGGGISLGQFGTAEGGEMLGILSKKNTKRFGKPMIELFDGINKGNDSKMMRGLSGLVISAMPEIKQGNQIVNVPKQPELSKMLQIMERPQETVTIIGNKKIIKQGNYTRIVHL